MEKEGLQDKKISLTDYVGVEDVHLDPDSIVDDGDKIHIGNIEFRVIHTPGHTKGGSSLYCEEEKLVFSNSDTSIFCDFIKPETASKDNLLFITHPAAFDTAGLTRIRRSLFPTDVVYKNVKSLLVFSFIILSYPFLCFQNIRSDKFQP